MPGDVEGEGLSSLLATDRVDTDVLLAPHHDSCKENPPELAEWANPELVIVGQGRQWFERTSETYRRWNIPVLATFEHGAVSLRVSAEGMTVERYY